MQGCTLAAIFAAETCTTEQIYVNQWSLKSRSWSHSACSESMQRTISMQGCTLGAIFAAEKCTIPS